ncbi:MAG: MATE family efflux transporter [Akkermansiaceae bacterium]|jgi:putative MATE family efflux protein|tara:strand:- start:12396 stop:13856 length:1461 start_codon:yes stop_codon:yes gene_type:complete
MARPGKIIEAEQRSGLQKADGSLAGRLGKLSLGRQVVALAIWPFLEQILSFMVNTVDLILATRMAEGDARVAIMDALGLGGYVMWLMMILQGAVATGVLAIISRAAGARKPDEAREGLVQGILAGLLMGVLSGLIIRLSLPTLIRIFGLSDAAAGYAFDYLSILCWSCPVLGIFYACTNALRAIGDTRTPFFIMLLINVSNAILSSCFVFLEPPIGGMGIAGLAYGSLLAWVLGAIIVVALLYRTPRPHSDEITLTLREADWAPQREMMARIGRVGLPQGVEMLGMWLIHAYVLRFITGLAFDGALGAHFIAIRVESLSFLPGFAIGTATATLVGQYLGANNPAMAMKALRTAWLYALAFMSAIGVFFLIAPEVIVHLILPETDSQATQLIAVAVPLVFICGIFQPALATTIVMKTSLRGAGATKTVMICSFACLILFRVIGITLYDAFADLTLNIIWIFMSIDLFIQAFVFVTIAWRGKWVNAQV